MTIENAKRLLDHYKQAKDDSSLSAQARRNAELAYADMKSNLEARGVKLNVSDKSKK